VAELQDRGLVAEIGYGRSIGGRSPILLSVVDDARHLISIDLANDELRGAVVNLRNEIITRESLPVQAHGGEDALALVYELIDKLMSSSDRPLLGIGIGTPGLVDTTSGVVLRAVNLDWQGLPLGDLLRARYRLPVYVANDSQLAALAQYMFGGDQYESNLIVVKVATGIGSGIVLDGRLFQGDGFGAGEVGHITVVENGHRCRCGNLGCLETVASIPAVIKRADELARVTPGSLLNKPADAGHGITFETVVSAFEAGDDAARQVVFETGRFLGVGAAILIGTLNVHRIVFLSPLARFGAPLADTIRQEMLKRSLPMLAQDTHVELVEPRPEMVIRGASTLLLAHELGLTLSGQGDQSARLATLSA
jgi:predicted NBD/HSP70 family sugar kinase